MAFKAIFNKETNLYLKFLLQYLFCSRTFILQLSAFTRFMNHNLRDFWFSVLGSKTYSDLDMKTLAYSEDFLKIKDEHHARHLTDANYGKERYDVNQISSMEVACKALQLLSSSLHLCPS